MEHFFEDKYIYRRSIVYFIVYAIIVYFIGFPPTPSGSKQIRPAPSIGVPVDNADLTLFNELALPFLNRDDAYLGAKLEETAAASRDSFLPFSLWGRRRDSDITHPFIRTFDIHTKRDGT